MSPRTGTVSEVLYPDWETQLIKFVWNRHQLLIRKNIRKCNYLDFMFFFFLWMCVTLFLMSVSSVVWGILDYIQVALGRVHGYKPKDSLK